MEISLVYLLVVEDKYFKVIQLLLVVSRVTSPLPRWGQ